MKMLETARNVHSIERAREVIEKRYLAKTAATTVSGGGRLTANLSEKELLTIVKKYYV